MLRLNLSILLLILFPVASVNGKSEESKGWFSALKKIITVFVDIVTSFFMRFSAKRKEEINKIDKVIDYATIILRNMLSAQQPAPDLEFKYAFGVYTCYSHGYVTDMRTLTKSSKPKVVWHKDGSVDVTVYYSLQDCRIVFKTFYLESMFFQKSGSMTVNFGRNKVAFQIYIPNLRQALSDDFMKIPCLMYIKRFDWADVGKVRVTLKTDGKTKGESTSRKLNWVLAVYNNPLVKTVKTEILRDLYNGLKGTSSLVCRHKKLDQQAKKFLATSGKRTYTNKFKIKCGELWKPKEDVRAQVK